MTHIINSPVISIEHTVDSRNLTIYAVVPSVLEHSQILGINSWLSLIPRPCVVLLGKHPSLLDFASSVDPQYCVSVDSDVDFTFNGKPFFNSIIARARSTRKGIAVLVDPNTYILPSFINILKYIRRNIHHDWLLAASSTSLIQFPFHLQGISRGWFNKKTGERATVHEVENFVRRKGYLESCHGIQLWAWNTGRTPLHAGVLPPFIYGAGHHNEWLFNEALASNIRIIMDISKASAIFRPENFTPHRAETYEVENNVRLSKIYGSYGLKPRDYVNQPAKLVSCGSSFCIINTTDVNMTTEKNYRGMDCASSLRTYTNSTYTNTYTYDLKSLLGHVAGPDKVVVLTVVSNSYRDMLMSWVCRLRVLNISNFIVGAVDQDLYRFGIFQGLPIFQIGSRRNDSDCIFGSICFTKVTKLKSRTVLRMLELGYHVLFSDVDVYWFSNPINELVSYGPGFLPAQTDEYNETEAVNVPRRLNSGFYFARSDNATITAFKKIIKHAVKSKLSEQPSFYDVLCGRNGIFRHGNNTCIEPETNLTVVFLDRLRYPNGAYRLIWESGDVKGTCEEYKCVILHNNWKTGFLQKIERQIRTGLWEYNPGTRMCTKTWENEYSKHLY